MPLTLVVGPANAAKAGEVLGAYRARLARGPLLVVPTRADVAVYERELAGEGGLLGGAVLSFAGLLREIARRAGYEAQVAGPLQRERLVAAAVAGAGPDGLGAAAGSPGFRAAAGDLLAELARERVGPGRLAAALRRWAGGRPQAAARAAGLVALAGGYEAALARAGLVDEERYAWGALDALRARPDRWGRTPVYVYGFDDLAPAQRDAVETLAIRCGAEVTVSLPYEPRAAFAGRARTVEDLRPLADGVVELPAREDFYAPAARGALHHLERHLFEPAPPVSDPGDAVRLLVAGGERAEAELVAAEVRTLLAVGGMRPEEVAVVHRDAGRAGDLLAGALEACGVPAAHERRLPAGHTALGRGLVGLVRAALVDGAPAEDLLAYLRTPGRLDRPELADALELACRRRGLRSAAAAREHWRRDMPGVPLRALDRLKRAAAAGAPGLVAAVRAEAERLFARPHAGRAPVLGALEAADARVHAALAGALDELAALAAADSGLRLGPGELADQLAAVEVRLGEATRREAVLVADPLGIRARRFRAVAVCGLQDGVFPRSPRPEPFLGDDARRELATGSALRLRAEDDAPDDERYLFYAVCSRPSEVLLLSCREADEEGNPELRSPFVDEVARLFGPALEARAARRPLAHVTWPAERAPTAREAARARAAAAPREPAPELGDLRVAAVGGLVRHTDVLSARALESYAACPVRWLVEAELDPERLEPDPDAMRRGAFVHQVVERTLELLRERTGSARVTPGRRAAADAALADAIAEARGELEAALPAVAARSTVREVAAWLSRWLDREQQDADGPFEPEAFELSFGFEAEEPGSRPALVLGEGAEAVRVRGRIDRVDVDGAGRALVRDYKSGRAREGWPGAKWESRDQLQVGLYMLAALRLLGREPAGGVYQPLRGDDLRPRGLVLDLPELRELKGAGFVAGDLVGEDGLRETLARVEARALELARELRAGRLAPRPQSCSSAGCRYPGVCRGAGT